MATKAKKLSVFERAWAYTDRKGFTFGQLHGRLTVEDAYIAGFRAANRVTATAQGKYKRKKRK